MVTTVLQYCLHALLRHPAKISCTGGLVGVQFPNNKVTEVYVLVVQGIHQYHTIPSPMLPCSQPLRGCPSTQQRCPYLVYTPTPACNLPAPLAPHTPVPHPIPDKTTPPPLPISPPCFRGTPAPPTSAPPRSPQTQTSPAPSMAACGAPPWRCCAAGRRSLPR